MIGRRFTSALALFASVFLVHACSDSPNGPSPAPALSLTCPGNVSSASSDGTPRAVTFNAPQSSGGTAPVTTTCTPSSGSTFPLGTSLVSCQARDAASVTASCTFNVVITGPPRLSVTRFLSFGDSLTVGVLSAAPTFLIVSPPGSYPFQLERRLASRYGQQMPVVLNEGNSGELASGTGVQRFRSVLLANRPEVVLLMEGTNDLLFGETGASNAINALAAMVREAKSQGIRIALATIPPQRAGGMRNRDAVVRLIPGFNDRIRGLAGTEQIPLIEVFNGMQGDNTLIGVDDLHMTERGYQVMADIYAAAIQANYEVGSGALGFNR